MKFFLPFLFVTSAMANFGEELISTNRNLKSYVESCKHQNDSLVRGSFKELAKPINQTEYFKLTVDYKKLAKILDNFQLSKQSTIKETVFRDLLFKKCSKTNLQLFRQYQRKIYSCRNIFDLFHLIEAIIYSTDRKDFPSSLRPKVKRFVLSYIKEESSAKTTLLNQLMGFDLLIEAAKYNVIDKSLSTQIEVFRSKSIEERKEVLDYQSRLKGDKLYNCVRVKKLMSLENELSKKLRERLKFLVNLIENKQAPEKGA